MQALRDAIWANQAGFYDKAYRSSLVAARLFARHGQSAAELHARVEAVYAQRSILKGEACLRLTEPLWKRLARFNYPWLKGQFLLERAQCLLFVGDFSSADRIATESRRLARPFPVLTLRSVGIAAGMQQKRGQCDEAWNTAQQGLMLYSEGQYPADRLDQFYAVMLQCARDAGRLYAAAALLRHILDLREAAGSKVSKQAIREGMLHLHLANILMALNQNADADVEKKLGEAKLRKIPQNYVQEFLLTTYIEPAELMTSHGQPDRAIAALKSVESDLSAIEDGFIRLSFYRAMGNAYWEMRSLEKATASYDSVIELAESALGHLRNTSERLEWLQGVEESYRHKIRILIEQNRQQEALATWEWYQSRPLLQPANLGEVRFKKVHASRGDQALQIASLASENEPRLVYAFFKDGLQIWVARDGSLTSVFVPRPWEYSQHEIRDFEELCAASGKEEDVKAQGLLLYSFLFKPIAQDIPEGGRIAIETDRLAYNLPWEALRHPGGWYLGEKYSFRYSPGIWMEKKLRSRAAIDHHANIVFLDAAANLPGKDLEKKAIKGSYPFTRFVTSKAALLSALPGVEIFHFSGHGDPDGAGTDLLLNDGSVLKSSDFSPRSLQKLELAVLEACSSGIGNHFGLMDTANLVQPVLSAGTPAVIAARWNVDSTATSELMSAFYGDLARNRGITESLFEARLQLIRSHKYSHPYYWAGFSLIGRPQ